MKRVSAVVMMGVCAGIAFAALAAAPAVPASLDAIVRQLGSDDFAAREQAQRALESLPVSQLPPLRVAAEKAADAETRQRLLEIVGKLEESEAMSPPRISIDVRDAKLPEIAAALSKATGATIVHSSFDGEPITLKVVDAPFWEVMQKLFDQQSIWVTSEPFAIGHVGLPHSRFVERGVAIGLSADRVVNPMSLRMTVTVAVDPRIQTLEIKPPLIDEVRDNLGNVFSVSGARAQRLRPVPSPHFVEVPWVLTAPQAPGTTLSIRGRALVTVQLGSKTTEIANAEKQLGKGISIGDSQLTVRQIGKQVAPAPAAAPAGGGGVIIEGGNGGGIVVGGGGIVRIGGGPAQDNAPRAVIQLEIVPNNSRTAVPAAPNVEITATGISLKGAIGGSGGGRVIIDNEGGGGTMSIGPAPTSSEAANIVLKDADGKVVTRYSVPVGLPVTSIRGIPGGYKEPLSLTVTVPTKVREVTVPFEFKDVPIP